MKTVERISLRTTLEWGAISAAVSLAKTTGETKLPEFERAGPSGEPIIRETRTRTVAEEPETDAAIPDVTEAELLDIGMRARAAEEEHQRLTTLLAQRQPVTKETYSALVDSGSGEEVTSEEVCRGIRLEDGRWLDLTEQLRVVDEITADPVMRVLSFIRLDQVPRSRQIGGYYLAADAAGGGKVLRLLYVALKRTSRVAVVKWVKSTRQAVGVVRADARTGALEVLELAWAHDFRMPGELQTAHESVAVTISEVEAAVALAAAMTDRTASLDSLSDDRLRLYSELRAEAEAGRIKPVARPERPEITGDLTDVLLRSAQTADDFLRVIA